MINIYTIFCQVARDRKSLMQALKIERLGAEEAQQAIRDQQKQQRDFRRQRFPNLKSPADDLDNSRGEGEEGVASSSVTTPLKVSPERN